VQQQELLLGDKGLAKKVEAELLGRGKVEGMELNTEGISEMQVYKNHSTESRLHV